MSNYNLFQLRDLLFTKPFTCHIPAYGMPHWACVLCCAPLLYTALWPGTCPQSCTNYISWDLFTVLYKLTFTCRFAVLCNSTTLLGVAASIVVNLKCAKIQKKAIFEEKYQDSEVLANLKCAKITKVANFE